MNPSIQISLLQLIAILAVVAAVAMLFKKNKLVAAQKRITKLENEMLRCHHEILILSRPTDLPEMGEISSKSLPNFSLAS